MWGRGGRKYENKQTVTKKPHYSRKHCGGREGKRERKETPVRSDPPDLGLMRHAPGSPAPARLLQQRSSIRTHTHIASAALPSLHVVIFILQSWRRGCLQPLSYSTHIFPACSLFPWWTPTTVSPPHPPPLSTTNTRAHVSVCKHRRWLGILYVVLEAGGGGALPSLEKVA